MDTYIILAYALKLLIIVPSLLGFLLAKIFVPEMRELLLKKTDKNRKMWFLVLLVPVIYILLGNLSDILMHSGSPFHPIFLIVLLWIFGVYFGTKLILGSDIEENKIRLGKFVTIYTIANSVFMVINYFIYILIFATNGY